MAEKRMFTKKITDSDAFLNMPLSAQALYFHLNMSADDDGFVNNPKRIQRAIGASDDDYNLLIEKRFVIIFETGIIVIKHWKMHNYIQKDRYKPTDYTEEKSMLIIKENKAYSLMKNCMDTECVQSVSELDTDCTQTGRVDKISIDKNSKDKSSINNICTELDEPAPCSSGIILPLTDGSMYNVPTDKVQMWVETFPGVNVMAELKKMYAWLDSNPRRKKTRRGIEKFIYGWLERAQNSGRSQLGKEPLDNYAEGMKGWMDQNE